MNINSITGTGLSDNDESTFPSLNSLGIQDKKEPNEGGSENVGERPWISILNIKYYFPQVPIGQPPQRTSENVGERP
uniref:Uncharacterized protein n=1 Tax=Strongyloides papillosus TaxID=174720 RepID=A0A0N5BZM9_STREA